MTRRIATSFAADDDIRSIASYIAAGSSIAAEQFGLELWATLTRIAEHPEAGAPVTGFSVSLRFIRVSRRFRRYLVFYRQIGEATIEIVRILHGAPYFL